MARMLDRLRQNPPTRIGDWHVTELEDLLNEDGPRGPLKGATDRQGRNVLHFRLGEWARVALRPSGTEPKAKIYVEASCPPCPPNLLEEEWRARCREVDAQFERLTSAFLAICHG